jgi:hypothetical protein
VFSPGVYRCPLLPQPRPPPWLPQVCRHLCCQPLLSAYQWQHLANTVWALATLQHHDHQALAAVEREVAARLGIAAASGAEGGAETTARAR